jgi:hypothetical protein
MTPLLMKGGESFDNLHFNFLLLPEEEYPDLSVRGRRWTFSTSQI